MVRPPFPDDPEILHGDPLLAPGAPTEPTRRRRVLGPVTRFVARSAFYIHLWIGVLATVFIIVVSITGILLNHKVRLGYQASVDNAEPALLNAAMSLAELVDRARSVDPALAAVAVDRMDVRPDDGLVKVRFEDATTTEVILRLDDGRVLSTAPRGDVFLERLHSGELFGDRWVLLSDVTAIGLMVLMVSGLWLWLFPRWRQ